MYCQVRPGDEPLGTAIARLAADANAVAPGLGRARAHELAELLLRPRITQTIQCGRASECHDVGMPLWGTARPRVGVTRPCCLEADDPFDLANQFAVAAANELTPLAAERDSLEERLAAAWRNGLGPILVRSDHCGRAAICRASASDPFGGDG